MIMPRSTTLRVAAALALAFLFAQLLRPKLNPPTAHAELQVPPPVKQILKTSCYPCHSNETRLSWFDRILPASQLVAHDVASARKHLNFSRLGAESIERQNAILVESLNQIQMDAMPLPRYLSMHPEAVVTPGQVAILRSYLLSVAPRTPSTNSSVDAADSQYRLWIGAGRPTHVHDAPNGIAFMPEYRDWQAISSTDREDTKTLRIILGNKIAVKAITENKINPWPDGAILAKVAWRQKAGENAVIETGEFLQVAFMIKDRVKYSSTAGWGWAQWDGSELKSHGMDASFANDCVACHAPLRKNDYVFTMPIRFSRTQR